jgi:hypothetical protein
VDEKALESTSDDATQLELLLEQLNTNQKRFIIARQEYTTDKDAALSIDLSPDTVKNWKYAGVPIDAVVSLMASDGVVMALHLRRKALAKAMAVKVAGLDEKDARLRQSVASEIVEWEMGKATQKQEITGKDGGPQEMVLTWPDGGIAETP